MTVLELPKFQRLCIGVSCCTCSSKLWGVFEALSGTESLFETLIDRSWGKDRARSCARRSGFELCGDAMFGALKLALTLIGSAGDGRFLDDCDDVGVVRELFRSLRTSGRLAKRFCKNCQQHSGRLVTWTYCKAFGTPICCETSLCQSCQRISSLHCILEDVLSCWAGRIFQNKEYESKNRKISGVHDEPIRSNEETFPFHLRCNVDNISSNTYTSSSASETPLINALGLAILCDVVQEWAVEHHLYVCVRKTQKLLYTAVRLATSKPGMENVRTEPIPYSLHQWVSIG